MLFYDCFVMEYEFAKNKEPVTVRVTSQRFRECSTKSTKHGDLTVTWRSNSNMEIKQWSNLLHYRFNIIAYWRANILSTNVEYLST